LFPSVAVDAGGAVYLAWSDVRNVYLSVSSDGGTHWSSPRVVNAAPSATAVMPTVAASGRGVLDIAWYGTTVTGFADDPAAMGKPGASSAAPWRVYEAHSGDGGDSFDQSAATGLVHTGVVCLAGLACDTLSGTRDLFDDFGIGVSPITGSVSVAYTSDEPEGDIAHDFTGFATSTAGP
jgi:hypothetical protein